MKFTAALLLSCFIFFRPFLVRAQSFTFAHDTINYAWPGGAAALNVLDTFNNPSTVVTDSVKIAWKVIDSDFPADWKLGTGVCDNNLCYGMGVLWPSGTLKTSNPYPDGFGDFHLQINLSDLTSPPGCHYVTIRIHNNAVPSDSATVTYIVCNLTAGLPSIKSNEEVVLYPNPASDDINMVYSENADIKSIAVYNIIGKVMAVYKVTSNTSANLNLENIPSGIYFVRLVNSRGQVMTTRKFTKQ